MNFEPAKLFDNNDPASFETWLEDAWRSFMDTQRAGWRNYAEVLLEPGNNSMDVIGALGHELDHFYKHILDTTALLLKPPGHTWAWEDQGDEEKSRGGWISARNGLDYVPYDNFPIIAHKGERVQTAEQARRGDKLSIGEIRIFVGNTEIKNIARIEADGVVVERNKRGSKLNPAMRVYS
jgi:hypothetical protein